MVGSEFAGCGCFTCLVWNNDILAALLTVVCYYETLCLNCQEVHKIPSLTPAYYSEEGPRERESSEAPAELSNARKTLGPIPNPAQTRRG